MDLNLQDKSYLVIGGTAGMGLAAAKTLAAEGAVVAVVGRDEERAKAASEVVLGAGARAAHGLTYDVSKPGAAVSAVGAAVELLGGTLHGIAITMGTAGMMPIDSDDDAWDGAFHDVVLATTRSVQAALPHLSLIHI